MSTAVDASCKKAILMQWANPCETNTETNLCHYLHWVAKHRKPCTNLHANLSLIKVNEVILSYCKYTQVVAECCLKFFEVSNLGCICILQTYPQGLGQNWRAQMFCIITWQCTTATWALGEHAHSRTLRSPNTQAAVVQAICITAGYVLKLSDFTVKQNCYTDIIWQ